MRFRYFNAISLMLILSLCASGLFAQKRDVQLSSASFVQSDLTNSSILKAKSSNAAFTPTVLFYGNTAKLNGVDGGGYVTGPNKWNDKGKYQRFDFTGSASLTEVRMFFGVKTITGTADNYNVVVKSVAPDGSPGATLFTKTCSANDIVVSTGLSVFNTYAVSPAVTVTGNFFVGIEWDPAIDDKFGLFHDDKATGEGEGKKRAWEQYEDGSFIDMDASWTGGFDADLWIAAVVETAPVAIEKTNEVPTTYTLAQNYPNPFNPSTTFKFSVPEAGMVTLKIYNALGIEVAELVSQTMGAGTYTKNWNATGFSSGIYYYRIMTSKYSETKKLILLK